MTAPTSSSPRRRRTLLIAGAAWLAFGVVLLVVLGGATGFIPDDPVVPEIGFTDAGDGRVAVEIGPRSFADTEGIEIRTGAEARDGRLIWQLRRTGPSPSGADGHVVVGEVPEGFEEVEPLESTLPKLWHAEVDNRCYFGVGVVPDALTADAITTEDGGAMTPATFRDADPGFSDCDSSTVGGRAAAFLGLISVAVGAVLIIAAWWDWRRGLPAELTGEG